MIARGWLVLLAAIAAPADSQVVSDTAATEVVGRYLDAMRSRNWMGCALLVHPEELGRLRRVALPVLNRDTTGRMAQQVLGIPPQLRVASLDSVEFAARLFAFYVRLTSPGTAFEVFGSPELLGSLPVGTDSAVVVYRFRLPADSTPLRSWQTKLVRRHGTAWRVDMMADFTGLLRELGARP